MKNAPASRTESPQSTKARILAAATKLFARKGYASTSTKEICKAAGANIAAVHYHFESKENLYRDILMHFGSHSLSQFSHILRLPATQEEFRVRLEMSLELGAEMIVEQPELTQIILRDIDLISGLSRDIFKKTFLQVGLKLEEFLEAAKNKGFLRPSVDVGMAAHFLNSQIIAQHRRIMRGSDPFKPGDISDPVYRKRWIRELVSLFLNGVLMREETRLPAVLRLSAAPRKDRPQREIPK
jgi:AcrR family transcriptional regulator